MQEMWVRFLGQEDPLEKEMATQFSILAREIPWTVEPGRLPSPWGHRFGHDLVTEQQQQKLELMAGLDPSSTLLMILFTSFYGRTDVEAQAPKLWPSDSKSWLTRNDPDAEKDWTQKEKGAAEDEMVRYHHQLNGHEFEQTPGDGEGQRSLACCSPWGHKELDMT